MRAGRDTPGSRWGANLTAAVPLAWLAVLFVVPLGFTVVYAFGRSVFGAVELGFTLDNFRTALSGFYLDVFLRSLRFAALGTLLCLVVAVPVAYFVARKAGRWRTPLLLLVLVPYLTSFLLRILAWKILLSPGGQVEWLLNAVGLHHGRLDVLYTQTAVFVGIVYAFLPLMVVPLYVAFQRIPERTIEASKDLGAGRLRTFAHVTLPLARPGIATAVLLVFVPMAGEVIVPDLLGGGKGMLMGGLIGRQYLNAQNYALGSAMAVLVLVVLALAVVVLARVTRSFDEVGA
ncbi:ABC transporter permease [Patulibacter sp. S7RM1-6]